MRIVLGADHGGFKLKDEIKKWLETEKYKVMDVGADELNMGDDYVDYAALVAEEVAAGEDPSTGSGQVRGLLFCRNGFGMMIAANRFSGVRCGEAFDAAAVKKGRTDDDINCLSIPADYIKDGEVKEMIKTFLETEFSGEEKYKRRLWKLETLGGGCCGGGCGDCG